MDVFWLEKKSFVLLITLDSYCFNPQFDTSHKKTDMTYTYADWNILMYIFNADLTFLFLWLNNVFLK
jgi:hypothetical protein